MKAKLIRKLYFDYTASKKYCKSIGLEWLGDDWVRAADEEAHLLKFSQKQVDAAMRHHLSQIKYLFTPKAYKYSQRIMLAFWFLTGWQPAKK